MVRRTSLVLNLAFLRLHEWLIPTVSNDAFRAACRTAAVSKIGFLRHGKTAPKPENGLDFDRILTALGRDQAREAGASFGKELLPFHPSILVSPAPRTVETARLFLDAAKAPSSYLIEPVQGLYDGTMQPEGSQLFQKIGYAPLRDYVDSDNAEDRATSRRVFGEYSTAVIDAMTNAMMKSNVDVDAKRESGLTLWVVGHAIYLSAAALGAATLLDCNEDGLELIMSSNTRETEGFLVDVQTSEIKYVPSQT